MADKIGQGTLHGVPDHGHVDLEVSVRYAALTHVIATASQARPDLPKADGVHNAEHQTDR